MSFAPVRLGNTVLEAETAAADRNSCRRFGPCGVGEKALYLNDLLIDRHFYVGFGSVRRVFKRVAMSQGGFSGKGAFGSIPYLVVQYDDGQEKQCTFKREEDVDELLAYLGQVHPEIPRLSVGGEQRLAKKAQQEASRYLKELTPQAQSAREELERRGEIPTAFGETLSAAYRRDVRSHPVGRWDAPTAILYAGTDHLTPRSVVDAFAAAHGARVTVMEEGEHWFHTPEQTTVLRAWLDAEMERLE